MFKKLMQIFIWNNIAKILLIIFCITLSLTWFLVSDNLTRNVQNLIWNDAKPLLWWDINIKSSNKLNTSQLKYLENLVKEKKIALSTKIETSSTINDKQDNPDLVNLVFIDNKYPLYWDLEINKKWEWVYITQNIQDLFVKNNTIEIYWKTYNIWWIITKITDSWLNLFDDWKKILIDINEFEKLKLDQLWARINWEYLIKVNSENDFREILTKLKNSWIFSWIKIDDYTKGWDRFSEVFSELDKYIKYILIIFFILTSLIIFLSIESFYISNKKDFSILRILWFKNINLINFNILVFLTILIICSFLTIVLSMIIFYFIRNYDLTSNFYIDFISIIKVIILWIIILWISVILPLFKFLSSNPLSGLKENFLQIYSKKEIFIEVWIVFFGVIIIYALIIWNFLESLIFASSIFLWVFLLVIVLKYLLKFVYKKTLYLKNSKFYLFDAIRNTVNPWNLSVIIFFAFIFSFTALLFISIISLNFLSKLNIDLNNNNNIYVINLNEKDINNIEQKYKKETYSIILWRILSINNISLKEHLWTSWISWRFSREFNITDNELESVKILKWNKIKSWEVSVDSDFAESLNLKLWDEVEFFIYWIEKKLIVSNIRQSIWDSIQPFFYFQVYSEDFKSFPKKYFLSTSIPENSIKEFKREFLEKTWSNISFIDLNIILSEIKSISKKVFIIIQISFIYTFIFCIISLIVCIIFLIPFKKKKAKMYNILWASNLFINKNTISEYFYLESLAYLISIILASSFSYFILGKSNFINFWFNNYLLSLLFWILIFALLFLLIKILIQKISKI